MNDYFRARSLFDAWKAQTVQHLYSLKWENLNKDERESWVARAKSSYVQPIIIDLVGKKNQKKLKEIG